MTFRTNKRWLLAIGFFCLIASAKADPNVAPCGSAPLVAQEYIANGAVRRFDTVDQVQGGLSYFRSACNGEGNGRWIVTGAASLIDEEGAASQSLLGQAGYQFVLAQVPRNSWHLTPMVLAGYEHFEGDRENVVLGLSSSLQWTHTINEINDGVSVKPGVLLSLVVRPEYQWRSAVGAVGDDGDSFSTMVSATLDIPYRSNRVRLGVIDQEYSNSTASVSSIQTASFGFRPVCGPNDEYPWSVELLLQRGDKDYSAASISFSIRNTSGASSASCGN